MKKKLTLAVCFLASLFFLSGADNAGPPELGYDEKPYHIGDNELIAVIGGLPLYYDELRYHASAALGELGLAPETADWDASGGLADWLIEVAVVKAVRWRVLELAALEAGIEADESAVSAYAEAIAGGWATARVAIGAARALLLNGLLFKDKYGAYGSELPDDDAYIYGAESGIIRVKSIYFSTSEALITEKEIDAKREQAAIFAAELRSGTASFDDIMRVYGESEPDYDGYQFAAGGVSETLYGAAASLGVGESGGVLEVSGDGLYILMRLELQPDDIVRGMSGTLRYAAAATLYDNYINNLCMNINIVYADAFDKVNPKLMFEER